MNTNRHPISCHFGELSLLIIQILDTLHFEPPLEILGATYDVYLGLTGKRVVLIELFP